MESFTSTHSLEFCDSSHLHMITPDDIDGLLFVRVGTIYGGYDPEFFQENMEEHFVCPICKGILSCPTLIVECGHVFCERCIQETNRFKHSLFAFVSSIYLYFISPYSRGKRSFKRYVTQNS